MRECLINNISSVDTKCVIYYSREYFLSISKSLKHYPWEIEMRIALGSGGWKELWVKQSCVELFLCWCLNININMRKVSWLLIISCTMIRLYKDIILYNDYTHSILIIQCLYLVTAQGYNGKKIINKYKVQYDCYKYINNKYLYKEIFQPMATWGYNEHTLCSIMYRCKTYNA